MVNNICQIPYFFRFFFSIKNSETENRHMLLFDHVSSGMGRK